MREVTCCRCGRVSVAITAAEAQAHVAEFNAWRATLPADRRDRHYPHPASVDSYGCPGCGSWGPYRPALPGDAPDSVTISRVIWDSA